MFLVEGILPKEFPRATVLGARYDHVKHPRAAGLITFILFLSLFHLTFSMTRFHSALVRDSLLLTSMFTVPSVIATILHSSCFERTQTYTLPSKGQGQCDN